MKYKYFILFISLIFLIFFPVHLWYFFDLTKESHKYYAFLELIIMILISFFFVKKVNFLDYNELLFSLSFISLFLIIPTLKSAYNLPFASSTFLNVFFIWQIGTWFLILISGLLKLKITPFLSIIWLWQWVYKPIEYFYKCRITKEWNIGLGNDIGQFLSFALAILSVYTMYRYFQEFVFHKRN